MIIHPISWALRPYLLTMLNLSASLKSITDIDFIGEVTFPTGTLLNNTEIGGLSGITYDPITQTYYTLSDDRGNRSDAVPARFYTLNIDLSDSFLDTGDIIFNEAVTLLQENNTPYPSNEIDPEGISFIDSSVYISSEGNSNILLNPFVNRFNLNGELLQELVIPNKYLPTADQSSGIRNNLAFESLTITPNQRYLYTAVENALYQDGTGATLNDESAVRIVKYDLETGEVVDEFLYFTDAIPNDSNPSGGFADNGLVELLAIDNTGSLLALERSFAAGVGNNLRLYEVRLQGATDISDFESLAIDPNNANDGLFDVDAVAEKRLLLDFSALGIPLDNSEGITLGEVLPNGKQSLIVVSDNNFSNSQTTQFLAFELDINTIPAVTATVETPSEIRYGDPNNPDINNTPDGDDPAIYVHPSDASQSIVITTFKNGGLRVYDLAGSELQRITPPNIRYNNVDLIYGFDLNGENIDLAVASDRFNDTLAVYQINPNTRQLSEITSSTILDSIFGVDDGEATAYGLATYTSPVSGKSYAFVSQADGNQIAQLELKATNTGEITAEVVRIITVPIPDGEEAEDAQVEGIVVDRELGYLYVAQEGFGIWKFFAEADSNNSGFIVDVVKDINADSHLAADVEGLTLYYGENGNGYLFASSQGDSTYNIYDRGGSNSYLRSFFIGESDEIDSVEESDGADIINVSLGDAFPSGLLVIHDGSNTPEVVFQDPEDGEIQNFNTNFKYVDLADLAETVPILNLNPIGYDPRNPQPNSLINRVASGDTTQNSTVLWARSTFTGEITFEYSTDADFSTIIATESATVTDPTLPIKVEISDLTPHTHYYYLVTDSAGDIETGEFMTAAALGTQNGLVFGVSGDWRGELAPYPAISNVSEQKLTFFVEHGDTIYADIPSDAVKNPDGSRKAQAETLEEYRAKHSEVYDARLGLNTWSDLRRSTSVFATIDDHEVTNDFAGGAPASTDERFPETEGLINDTQLYETGLQVFQEYNPIKDEFYGDVGDERFNNERKLYRYQNYGNDAAVIVLDTRSFRDEGLTPPSDFTNPTEIGRVLTESLTLDRTLLGETQLNDLKQDLLDAQAEGITWKFIMIPEPIQNIFPGINTDAYEGYSQERAELLKFINDSQIDNVVFIAADVHTTFVNNLTYQEIPFGEQIPTTVWEITTGAVAFDAPTGEFLANLFTAGNPPLQAFYNSLPIAPDTDSLPNDKDDFVKQAINNSLLKPLGFDPLGLNDNLPQADGLIDTTLVQGDYFVGHTYGWTAFEINPTTQQLTVTTYGLEAYTEAELLANPDEILNLTPQIVSQFTVNPQLLNETMFSEDFNLFTGTGFAPDPNSGQLNSNAWVITGLSDGDFNFGDTATSGDFARGLSNGGVSTGGVYSFTVADGNNLLGIQPTGSDFTAGEIILKLQNTGESDLNQVEIDYDIWYLNDQPRANSLNFSYSTDGITYLSLDDLGFISSEAADASPSWQTVERSTTITGLTLNPDDFFYLKWTGDDVSGSGSRDEYGIDNVIISGLSLPDVTPPDVTPVRIHEIQGEGFQSPLTGETVIIEAIVVGDFQGSTGLSGFFLQEEDADADGNMATSEGIFIFDGSFPMLDVNIGDLVQVTGTVAEFNNLTELTSITNVQVISSDNALPTAATLNFPITGDIDLESVEGMLINLPNTLFVTEYFNLDRFGEVRLSSDGSSNAPNTDGRLDQYTQFNVPNVEGFTQYQADIAKRQIILDDGSTRQNPETLIFGRNGNPISQTNTLRGGDTVTGITAVLDERFGDYRLQNNEGIDFQAVNERPDTPDTVGGSLKVAGFNVLNFFTTLDEDGNPGSGPNNLEPRGANSQTEFDRQLEKLVTTLTTLNADIIGLTELENEFGGDQNGDGEFAIDTLVNALNDRLGAGTYAYVDPNTNYVGSDAISVGVIYQPAKVQIAPNTTVELLTDADLAELNLNLSGEPIFEGEATSRVPLAVTFLENASGGKFTLTVNHFKSKGQSGLSDTSNPNFDQGDGQGFWNFRRTEAAKAIDAWLKTDPTGSNDTDFLIIGDLNSYAQEDPITFLKGQGYTNLVETFVGDDAYSYLFDGQFGTLDYGLANAALNAQVTGASEWHINADEPDALDYNLDFGRDPNLFDGSIPFRTSDHDPVVIGLNLQSDAPKPPLPKWVSGTAGDDIFDSVFPDSKRFEGDKQILLTGSGNDTVDVTKAVGGNTLRTASGDDIIYAGINNRIDAGKGDDLLFLGAGGGNNRVTGGSGADIFYLTEDDTLLPTNPNWIGDFKASEGDLIGFLATDLTFESLGSDWNYRQMGSNTIIEAFGQAVAILQGINAISLTEDNFTFT